MKFKIKKIENKEIWENFLLECGEKTFLQSWNWGELQQKMGNKIWRLGIFDNNELISVVLIIKIIAKRGTFLLIQHGPNIKNPKSEILNPKQIQNSKFEILNSLFKKLKEIAKEEKASFIRIASLLEKSEENNKLFRHFGFRNAPMHANAYEATWKLDLTIPENEIFKNMRKTTRYLIRQALKEKDIIIEKSQKIEDAEIYQKLNQETAKRQKFVPFSFEFIKNEFEAFSKENQALWFFGKYKGEIMAAALILFWSRIGFYHQAALSIKCPSKIPLSCLLQWEAIKEAKKRSCLLYDFWGYVNPKENPNHPWAGPTLFKMGFGGYKKEYLKTRDFPLSKKYWLIYLFEKLRKTKRGL